MPDPAAFPFPLSINAMPDEQLKSFIKDPNSFLEPLKGQYVQPSIISDETRSRIEQYLATDGNSAEDITKKLDTMAMVKLTQAIIDI